MPASDLRNTTIPGDTSPALSAVAISPSNSTVLPERARGLYVGGAGDVVLGLADGTQVTFRAMVAGMIYPIRFERVLATGTTASDLVALW